jgi:signal transduction histidine kinase
MRFARFPWQRSLATQLLCTYTAAALLLTMLATAGIMWFSSRPDAGVTTQEQLHKVIGLIRKNLQFDTSGTFQNHTPMAPDLDWVFRNFAGDAKYRVLDQSERVILSSNDHGELLAPVDRSLDSSVESFNSEGEPLFVTTERITRGAQTYYIQVGVTQRLSAFVRALTANIRISVTLRLAFASVILVTIAVYFTLRRVLKPLREASAAASQIDARNLSRRLSTHQLPSEFLPLVTAFNLTLDRLEKGYSVQRAFLADAAHELKTPLSLIRAQIDMEGATPRQALLQDIDRMARLVNQLLHLAEASETQNYVFESVDPAGLVEDVSDYLRPLAERHQVYVDIRPDPLARPVEADRGALFMLLKNLLENAIQHSPAGGVVTVRVSADDLSVCDDGPGIKTNDLPQLFKRFWRGPARRNDGTGLGLSICAEIAAAHNWKLTARNADHGAQFTVLFL